MLENQRTEKTYTRSIKTVSAKSLQRNQHRQLNQQS